MSVREIPRAYEYKTNERVQVSHSELDDLIFVLEAAREELRGQERQQLLRALERVMVNK